MLLLFYFFIGLTVTFVGALPPGTVNLSVINTTIKHNTGKAMKIAYTAAISEVILALTALNFGMLVVHFIDNNLWIQVILGIVLLAAGIFILLQRKKQNSKQLVKRKSLGYINGFVLGLLNPPVLVYWVFITGFLSMYDIHLNMIDSLVLITIFLLGVYLGKVGSLFFYSGISALIKGKISNASFYMNRIIGIVLITLSITQAIKLLIF